MTYIVTTPANDGSIPYFLKGTIWTSFKDTARRFDTVEEAQAALDRAKKFNAKAARKAKIIED